MNDKLKLLATGVFCTLTVLAFVAATPGDKPAKARTGAVQISSYDAGTVSADGGVQPTKVFTALLGRNAFNVYNNGTWTIWCSWNSNVTPSNGFPIVAGASLSVDLTYNGTGDQDFYCTGTAGNRDQDAPADTRWIQVK